MDGLWSAYFVTYLAAIRRPLHTFYTMKGGHGTLRNLIAC
ncbi:hypothetical protein TSMEX_004179 [Taenia solium]|eukprot:TsM_000118900 transcript=TsM_000118900 gene=TsM_000118900